MKNLRTFEAAVNPNITTKTLNIGLENNAYSVEEITSILQKKLGILTYLKTRIHSGQWNSKPERTLIVQFDSAHAYSFIIALIEELCEIFTQEAIAVKSGHYGVLVYNQNFAGEKFTFDNQYFINF